ncbi:MAG: hypothetical protein Q4E69_00970 [Bacilli bacterium]|nr:hypothetical protein [Bacilli bacterium]
MYKDLVLKYIHLLTPNHIDEYARNNNIILSKEENLIIYRFILENYKDLLDNKESINKLKPLIRDDLYKSIEKIYYKNKAKYID